MHYFLIFPEILVNHTALGEETCFLSRHHTRVFSHSLTRGQTSLESQRCICKQRRVNSTTKDTKLEQWRES